jgi:hypothetical protein
MLRATFSKTDGGHTLLAKPEVKPLKVTVPAGYGYILTSKSSGRSFAVADAEFVQREIFKQLPKYPDKLVIVLTHNTTYYADGDATVYCSWGTHGVDAATGNSFVLGSTYTAHPPLLKIVTCSRLPSSLESSSMTRYMIPCSMAELRRLRRYRSCFHLLPSRGD